MNQNKKTILKSVAVLGLIAVISAAVLTVANMFLKPVFNVDEKLKVSLSRLASFNGFGELENTRGGEVLVAFRILDGGDEGNIIILSKGSGYLGEIQVLTLFEGDTVKKIKIHTFDGNDRLDNRMEAIEDYFEGIGVLPARKDIEDSVKSVSVEATITNNGIINAVFAASEYYSANKSRLQTAAVANTFTIGDIPAATPKLPVQITKTNTNIKSRFSELGYPLDGNGLLTEAEPLSVVYDESKSFGAYRSTLEGSEGNILVIGSAVGYGSKTVVFVEFDAITKLSVRIEYITIGFIYEDEGYPIPSGTTEEQYKAALGIISANAKSMWAGKTKSELAALDIQKEMSDKVEEVLGDIDVSATLTDTRSSIAAALLNALTVFESNAGILFEGGE